MVGLLLIGAGAFALAYRNSGAHQVSMNDARKRFNETSSSAPAAPNVVRPPAGVYRYTGTGAEHLSKPPKDQSQGPVMPATVTYTADGCWVFRLDFNSNHWQSWTYCPRDGGMWENGGQTFQRFDFVVFKADTVATFTCESQIIKAGMQPGDEWQQRCTGTNTGVKGTTVTAGPFRYVGEETLTIGGVPVPAYRFHQERTMSSAQSGWQTSELWFAKSNGMPLKEVHDSSVTSDSIIGKVDFTDKGEFTLSSLQPE